jgi:hypothetical protein
MFRLILMTALTLGTVACGSDADDLGVGAQCTVNDDCNQNDGAQVCLPFKGGYCGLMGCTRDADCPDRSACIAQDGTNYCFRICADKPDCNANRSVDNEANCSSSATFVEGAMGRKACVPPS